ncbi:nucleotidyltransferase domain-containing protein [Saxibacter everestensis]|uniref:Nucleotidyltransferase domain-containing protein n=1 Tax=Saxibacter everestensis TaxID=2909229 RepID=A0ABY8QSG3_9MICO|nr:nucleotidyltransferase domain-containing protein [Brevibacteriaceae bacterium ZFBP1038]
MDGHTLRDYRQRYGLSQAEVAREAGMRQPDLSAIEHNRRGSDSVNRRVEAAIRRLVRPSAAIAGEQNRRDLRETLLKYGARDIRVFGSTARGDDRPGSDLDIMATFPPGFDLFDLMAVEADIEARLGIHVDVVSEDHRTPYALAEAKADAVPL